MSKVLGHYLLFACNICRFVTDECNNLFFSVSEENPTSTDPTLLAELLKRHCDQYLHQDESKMYRITVQCGHLWQDALNENFMKEATTFLGEPAVDDGGQCREFLMLLMEAVNSQELLCQGCPPEEF